MIPLLRVVLGTTPENIKLDFTAISTNWLQSTFSKAAQDSAGAFQVWLLNIAADVVGIRKSSKLLWIPLKKSLVLLRTLFMPRKLQLGPVVPYRSGIV